MAKDIVMPKMGYDMTEGKLLRWIKHEGDTITKGEAVAEIETDKVNIEVEAFDSGGLQRILVQEGATVPVGERIATLAAPRGPPPSPAPQPAPAPGPEAVPEAVPTAAAAGEKPLTRLQQTMARRMVESKTRAPHFYLTIQVDMTAALALRQQLNAELEASTSAFGGAEGGAKISLHDPLVKAPARAAAKFA